MGRSTTNSKEETKLTKFTLYFEEYKRKISPSKWLMEKMAMEISRDIRRSRRHRRVLQLRKAYFECSVVYINHFAVTV